MKLGKISDITMGMVLARKQDKLRENNKFIYKTITLKSLNINGYISKEYFEDFYCKERIDESALTKANDIVIRLSEPHTAVYIKDEHSGLVVPANFATIRVNDENIRAEFIKFYLNSLLGKREILKVSAGTALNTITIANLKEIKIQKYSKELQDKFIDVNKLFAKEAQLLTALIEEKSKLLDSINVKLLK